MTNKNSIKFWNPNFSNILLFKHWIIQKLIGINRKVPWAVHWTTEVKSPQKINPGSRCPGLSMGCYLDGRNGIIIGDNVWIGPRVSLISMNHNQTNYQEYNKNVPIEIGNNCWIGANAVILPGVKLTEHVIVAAGAVVTETIKEKNVVVGGVPAKIIKKIDVYNNN